MTRAYWLDWKSNVTPRINVCSLEVVPATASSAERKESVMLVLYVIVEAHGHFKAEPETASTPAFFGGKRVPRTTLC
jgi:hypothetical protein